MLPWPPHWATRRPPGRSAACSRAKSRSWSVIQWKTAQEKTTSTGASSCEVEQVLVEHRHVGRQRLARLGDHRGVAVDGDHLDALLEQQRRHPPAAAAGVEHALAAA